MLDAGDVVYRQQKKKKKKRRESSLDLLQLKRSRRTTSCATATVTTTASVLFSLSCSTSFFLVHLFSHRKKKKPVNEAKRNAGEDDGVLLRHQAVNFSVWMCLCLLGMDVCTAMERFF